MEEDYSKIMQTAERNRKELIGKIETEIIVINTFLQNNNWIIEENIKQAKNQDVNYVPDRSGIDELNKWIQTLKNAKEKLQGLKLNQDEIMYDQGEIISRSQDLLDYINEHKKELQSKFARSNMQNLISAISEKKEIKERINELKRKIEELENNKGKYQEQRITIQRKIDRLRLKFLRRKKVEQYNSERLENESNNSDNEMKIVELKGEMKQLQDRLRECRYKNSENEGKDSIKRDEIVEDKEEDIVKK